MNSNDDRVFEALLDFLRRSRGFDFTGYKRSTLKRRVRKQMHSHNIDNFSDYLDYLQVHPEEFSALFNTILINVTSFFRDVSAWEYFQDRTLQNLLNAKPPQEKIRIWSVGCSSGEEPYTLAMILAEAIGVEQFRQRVKIYATDMDRDALVQARQGIYDPQQLEVLPNELREKYFQPLGERWVVNSDLRRGVIFGCHDLVQDAPISRVDLLVCRNTLMYFNAETQSRILARFHFALTEQGALFLGKAEMLLTHTNLFTPLSLQHRIFTKVPKRELRDRLMVLAQGTDEDAGYRSSPNVLLREAAFNKLPIAQLVVDFNHILVLANQPARSMFRLNLQDIGKPLQDLEISYYPLELRSRIQRVYRDRTSVKERDVVRHLPENYLQYLDVELAPLEENGSDLLGVSITFTDVTRYHDLQEQLLCSTHELETANEELQSSNEELETTNEELQSTNEELETMNEELHSTNEELQTINDELQLRTNDLNQANAFLHSILTSFQSGVVVVNREFNITSWNKAAEDLWGLRADEVEDRSIFSLDIGLPVDPLREPMRQCLAGEQERPQIIVDALNRRGRSIQCCVSFNPLQDHKKECQGVILMMEAM